MRSMDEHFMVQVDDVRKQVDDVRKQVDEL